MAQVTVIGVEEVKELRDQGTKIILQVDVDITTNSNRNRVGENYSDSGPKIFNDLGREEPV